jgi:hypothetical protein
MTSATAAIAAAASGECPQWCTGRHGHPSNPAEAETARSWHISATCPPWCIGHGAWIDVDDQDHMTAGAVVKPASAPPVEMIDKDGRGMRADYVHVSAWQPPGADRAPLVTVWHAGPDVALPDLTAGESVSLGAALIAAALQITMTTPADCPAWCSGQHEDAEGPAVMLHDGRVRLAVHLAGHVLVHDITPAASRDYLRLREEVARLNAELDEATDRIASAMTEGLDGARADEAYERAADALTEALDQGAWEG